MSTNTKSYQDNHTQTACYQQFEYVAALYPDTLAIVANADRVSYGELNQQANQLAACLQSKGVATESVVAICLPRSIEMVVAMLAIHKAGGAYLPIDPQSPDQRIQYILKDAAVKILITEQDMGQRLSGVDIDCLNISSLDLQQKSVAMLQPEVEAQTDHLSYIIYTSGSTGKPKGVMIEHGSLVNLTTWFHQAFAITQDDRISHVSGVGFDASVWEIWPTLTKGACLYIADEETKLQPTAFLEWLDSLRISVSWLPTPLMEWLFQLKPSFFDGKHFPRLMTTAGEQLKLGKPEHFPCPVYNCYGPTEDTVCSSYALVPDQSANTRPAIGQAIANKSLYVLSDNLQPLATGEVGEIYIAGPGLARGYLGNPAITAERFIANPFSNKSRQRLYKTGDLGYWSDDGQLAYVGRIDNQVKIRGFRIELGEIEFFLSTSDLVKDSAVLASEDKQGNKGLVAYIVPSMAAKSQGSEYLSSLRQYLKSQLPDYMIPSTFVELEHLPLTQNDKVNRRALMAIEYTALTQAEHVAPNTETERSLCEIWQQVFNVESIGIHDDFFMLGGNSLLAMQIVSKINNTLSTDLPVKDIYENKTISELAERVENTGKAELLPLERVVTEGHGPISYPQLGAWGIANMEGFKTFYNMVNSMIIDGPLNVAALRQSLQMLIERHETLRMHFAVDNEQIVLVVDESQEVDFPLMDLTSETEEQANNALNQLIDDEETTLFDLHQGRLIRGVIVKLAEQRHAFVLTMHHLISDGWSINIFKQELAQCYHAYSQQNQANLEPLSIHYSDFAYWQHKWHDTDKYRQQIAFWHDKLASFKCERPFPIDTDANLTDTGVMRYLNLSILATLFSDVEQFAAKQGTTLYTLLMAALHLSLYRYSGLSHQMVYSPIAGRSRPELESSIGLYVNMISILSEIDDKVSLTDFAEQIKQTIYDAQANADVSMLVMMQQADFTLPVFPCVVFNYIDLPNSTDWMLPGLQVELIERDKDNKPCLTALDLFIQKTEQGVDMFMGYNTSLFKGETIELINGFYQQVLEAMVTQPKITTAKLFLLE